MEKHVLFAALTAVVMSAVAFASIDDPSLRIIWQDESGSGADFTIDFGNAAFINCITKVDEFKTKISISKDVWGPILNALGAGNSLSFEKFDFTWDADPFVAGGFSAYNPMGSTKTYTFIFTSPVSPQITPSCLYGGSMSGSFTAGMSTPATVTTVANTPLYLGIIDGTPVLPIYPDPASWSVAVPFASGGIAAVNVPTTNPGPSVLNNISMQFTFTLTPDDTATMNGVFEVLVPEPATFVLLSIGGLLLRKHK